MKGDSVGVKNKLCIQAWVKDLSHQHQSGVFSALRGCDDETSSLKIVTKQIRYLVIEDFKDSEKYMTDSLLSTENILKILNEDALYTNYHWRNHIVYVVSILATRHPDAYVKHYWTNVMEGIDFLKYKAYELRLFKEYYELFNKHKNLIKYLKNNEGDELHQQQLKVMNEYLEIIKFRITDIDEEHINKIEGI
jgi:hypothetical protein